MDWARFWAEQEGRATPYMAPQRAQRQQMQQFIPQPPALPPQPIRPQMPPTSGMMGKGAPPTIETGGINVDVNPSERSPAVVPSFVPSGMNLGESADTADILRNMATNEPISMPQSDEQYREFSPRMAEFAKLGANLPIGPNKGSIQTSSPTRFGNFLHNMHQDPMGTLNSLILQQLRYPRQ